MTEALGYRDGWVNRDRANPAADYLRGYAEGCEDRRRADIRRDGSSYRISTRACQPIGVRRERETA